MSNFGKEISKFKMVIYLKNQAVKNYFSLVNEEKKGAEFVLQQMERRLLNGKHKGKYQTALIFDQKQDKLLRKYVNGKLELV